MLRSIIMSLLAIIAYGCQNQNKPIETTRFYEDGRAKPVVLITPIIDSTSCDIPWSLSDEFSTLIQQKLARKGGIFITQTHQTDPIYSNNPFSKNIAWMKKNYQRQEFVVFLELVEHANVPVNEESPKKARIMDIENIRNISTNLNMATRLRLVDLRGETPKIVLQELVTDTYYISKNHIDTDYTHIMWGMDEYNTSPMGMAHNQLAKEIAERLFDYIFIAQSR